MIGFGSTGLGAVGGILASPIAGKDDPYPGYIVKNDSQFYTKGSYSAYARFAKTNSAYGWVADKDYFNRWYIPEATFPTGAVNWWKAPETTVSGGGVWGFHHVDYGNFDWSPQQTPISPKQIGGIGRSDFIDTFSWKHTGSANFNLLSELFATPSAVSSGTVSGVSGRVEIGWFLHTADLTFFNMSTLVGTWTDPDSGQAWSCRRSGAFVQFVPINEHAKREILTGTINRGHALHWLAMMGQVDPTWWVNGISFGVEPTDGGGEGEMTINSWSVQMNGSTYVEDDNGTYDEDAEALFARMTAKPITGMKVAISDFVAGLKTDGIWSKLDAIYLPRFLGKSDYKKSLKGSTYDATVTSGTPGYVVGMGVDYGGNSYESSGFNPTTAGGQFAQNSMSMFQWKEDDDGTASIQSIGNANAFLGRAAGAAASASSTARGNNGATAFFAAYATPIMLVLRRTDSAGYQVRRSPSNTASDQVAASAAMTNAVIELGRAGSGTASSGTFSIQGFGGGLTEAEANSLMARCTTLRADAAALGL